MLAPRRGMRFTFTFATLLAFVCVAASSASAAPIVFQASGANAAAVQATVDAFRAALGPLNANVAGSFGSGRREINWDGVPDAFSAPNNLPADFFNGNVPGRARGVEFATPGTGFQVSANAGLAPVQFGNLDPAYPGIFEPFSQQRLFTALGSTITDVSFFVPGSATPATTSAFGVVFSDVDLAGSSLQFFDPFGNSLGNFLVPTAPGNETFSFLGVRFAAGEQIGRVRITSGTQVLSAGNLADDLVAMDDFIYAEPTAAAVPEPGTALLLGLGAGVVALARRRRR